ncbi:hypothetical protein NHX12_014998 [Muraenolepis orangiensis]|uniref:Immunoglobulin V-set domain-containing protein n=1 Tax=Muraenolepis orangiensis TaxID=630683 RepID=A0A9Q0I4E5_9TELE|nr:hypothetical protein NHX12_014998 [Muraenolepis orangiensis]
MVTPPRPHTVRLETASVAVGGRVFVPCPGPRAESNMELSVRLYKSDHAIGTCDIYGAQIGLEKLRTGLVKTVTEGVEVHMNTTASHGSTRFALTGVTAKDSGLYRCETKVIYPPPVLTHCDAPMVHLLLEGIQCMTSDPGPPLWIWITAITVLALYGALITFLASVKIVRITNVPNVPNEYMNTKRPQPRDQVKGGGAAAD